MKFVIALLIASVSAVKLQDCGVIVEPEIKVNCDGAKAGFNLGAQNAVLGGPERCGEFAKLTSESAGSQTQIGA